MKQLLLILCVLICIPATSAACNPLPGIPGEDVSLTLEHDGNKRTYVLHLPTGYDCTTQVPLLVGVHGYGGSGQFFENEWAGIFDHINEHGYIGLFPDGFHPSPEHLQNRGFNDLAGRHDEGPDGLTCVPPSWEYPVFDNCPPEEAARECNWGMSCADDLGFFRALITHVRDTYAVDPSRIYMVGYSQGGSTVNGLSPSLADLLAATAPMHGFVANGYAQGPADKLPSLQVWGRADDTVRGDGQPGSDRLIYESADERAAIWAAAQGCSADGSTAWPSSADGRLGWACTEHADCESGSEVVTCAWDGAHTWPRDDQGNFSWEVIWDFFKRHPRQ